MNTPTLGVGDRISGRFQVDELLGGYALGHVALGDGAGQEVVLVQLSADECSVMQGMETASHAHLAHVLEVAPFAPGGVLIAERVLGETLSARLDVVGKKQPVDAVRSTLRLADAATALHRKGAVHGGIGTDAVVLDPPGKDGPLLSFQGTRGMLRVPGADGPPTEADDTWAVSCLMFQMLTGHPPPASGLSSEDQLSEVEDPRLRAVLLHGLTSDPEARASTLKPLMGELARWFVDHAGDESHPSIRTSHPPPPLPGSTVSPVNLSIDAKLDIEPEPPSRMGRFIAFAIAASVLGALGVWAYSATRKPGVVEVAVPSEKQQQVAPIDSAQKEIDLSEVAVMGSAKAEAAADSTSACAKEYLAGAFDAPQPLVWMCEEQDAVSGANRLRVAVVKGSKGGVSDAMKLLSQAGWYDLPIYVSVRRACCTDAAPVKLPAASEGCEDLSKLTNDLAETTASGKPTKDLLDAFEKAAACEFQAGKANAFGKSARPDSGMRSQYETFASRFQHD
ncbi:MAG: hypothetical protein R3B89_07145 [Polyangiaceae bacterium]